MMTAIFVAFIALIVVVEPLGVVPYFMTLTRGRPRDAARRVALRASIVGGSILLSFALFGRPVLDAFGVRMDAFRVAGGLVLLLAALDMIRQKTANACRCTTTEASGNGDDGAVVPLAIPLLAGPGSMAATMGLVASHPTFAVVIAVILVFVVTYVVLRASSVIDRLIGPATLAVVQRVLGLLLAALSVQSIITGIVSLLSIHTA
jgi:multiple antibiotic resistance protein